MKKCSLVVIVRLCAIVLRYMSRKIFFFFLTNKAAQLLKLRSLAGSLGLTRRGRDPLSLLGASARRLCGTDTLTDSTHTLARNKNTLCFWEEVELATEFQEGCVVLAQAPETTMAPSVCHYVPLCC